MLGLQLAEGLLPGRRDGGGVVLVLADVQAGEGYFWCAPISCHASLVCVRC
jgi:hypothetical protein